MSLEDTRDIKKEIEKNTKKIKLALIPLFGGILFVGVWMMTAGMESKFLKVLFAIFGVIGLVALIGSIVFLIIQAKKNQRLIDELQKICPQCGGPMYGCAYEYKKVGERRSTSPNGGTILFCSVMFTATCPNCGKVVQHTREFKIDGYSQSLEAQVGNYCRKIYGH